MKYTVNYTVRHTVSIEAETEKEGIAYALMGKGDDIESAPAQITVQKVREKAEVSDTMPSVKVAG